MDELDAAYMQGYTAFMRAPHTDADRVMAALFELTKHLITKVGEQQEQIATLTARLDTGEHSKEHGR